MTNFLRLVRKVSFSLLLLTSIFLTGFLQAQGFNPDLRPPGVVPIIERDRPGLTPFFADSTILNVMFLEFNREVRLDSAQNHVIITEDLFGRPYRLPAKMDLDYYVEKRLAYETRRLLRQGVGRKLKEDEERGAGGIELNIPVKIKSKAFKRIFGGDQVGLRVSGNISFELAGRTESREGSALTSIEQRGNFSPKFRQTQQFRVEGKVGDKVTVSVDQNSEATFDFENTLKLTYEGDEDEIVQSIEAGNVNLTLPSTNYVSTTGNHQGLFGVKTEAQVGNFSFTGIASLERGENQKLTVTGGARENTRRLKDYEYVDDQFYFIDDYYRDVFDSPQTLDTTDMVLRIDPSRRIRQLDVWKSVSTTSTNNSNETFEGFAVVNPDNFVPSDTVNPVQGEIEEGLFKRLDENEYEFDFQRGYFWLKSPPRENQIIAVAYAYGPDDQNLTTKGMLSQTVDSLAASGDTTDFEIVLRLIRPRTPLPRHDVWDLTMRNVYNLGAAGISPDGFDLNVIYAVTGEDNDTDQKSGETYNYLMGLDRINEQGRVVPNGDKEVDLRNRFIFDLGNGYLIFPSKTPFNPDGLFNFDPERHVDMYNTTDQTQKREESKFEIEITTTSASSKYDLGFNVLEGSEKVILNGRELERDKDYVIDYFSGSLEITAPEARRADAQVEIEYERGQLFQLDKKTLIGGRLEYEFGERSFIGMTGVFYSKSTLDQRVRLGQEPTRNFVWDVNSAFHFKPNFLTTVFDKLPIVETSAESNLKVEAEFAQIRPNPNTFNEEDLGDNDGVAYIDDFEGSKRFTSLGIRFRAWTASSAPQRFHLLSDPTVDYAAEDFISVSDYIFAMDRSRFQFNWFNPFDQIPIQSIFPEKDVNAQTGTTTNVLTLRWRNQDIPVDSAWAGIMRSTASFANQEKTKFIELWVRGETGQINIDVGQVSEDYYVRGEFPDEGGNLIPSYRNLNTEDVNLNGLLDVDQGEDTGIDGVPGSDGSNVPNDAGNDDWAPPRETSPNFLRINGTEGNSDAQGARFPDTEDLDGDGILNLFNNYFEYSFELGKDSEFLVDSTLFSNGTPTGWKLYRIPLSDALFSVGDPDSSFRQVFNVRMWVNNIQPNGSEFDSIQIAQFDFVGNEWEEEGFAESDTSEVEPAEEKFGITVYNTDENPNIYTSPPNVEGIRDRITKAVSKEQSLVIQVYDLPSGARVEAKKTLRERINLINYERLEMFVHGDQKLMDTDSLVFFIRFGPTREIFYEYREPVYRGWDERNNIEIVFDELSKTKNEEYQRFDPVTGIPDTINGKPVFSRHDPNYPEKEFLVVGNPGLHNINYMVVGVTNRSDTRLGPLPIDNPMEVWIDEMRVTGVERQSGTAMRLSTNLGIADIANIRAQWELKDDNFRSVNEKFASENGRDQTRERQSYFASLRLHKFLPESWGFEIPVDGSFQRSLDIPKYFYNSDQRTNYEISGFGNRLKEFFGMAGIPEGLEEQVTFSESRAIGATFKRRDRSRDPWYLRYTFNQLVVDVDFSEKERTSPTLEFDENTSFSSRLSYSIPFGKDNFFRPLGWLGDSKILKPLSSQKLYYLPSSASTNFSLSDNKSISKNRISADPPEPTISVKSTRKFALKYKMLESLNFDFSRDYQSDGRLDSRGNIVDNRASDIFNSILTEFDFGQDTRTTQRFGANFSPNMFSWFSSNYRYSSNYVFSFDQPSINSRVSNLNVSQNVHVDFKPSILINKIYSPKSKGRYPSRGRGRGGRRPSQSEGEGEEEEGKAKDDAEEEGGSFSPPNPAMLLWHIFDSFKSISFDFRFDDSYGHHNLDGTPVWQYQFGFRRDPGVSEDTTFGKILQAPNIKKTRGIDGSLNLDILQNLQSSFTYNYQKVDNQHNEQRTQSISNTVFFTGDDPDANEKFWWDLIPDWRFSLTGVESFPLFNLFARTATLEHSRKGRFTESSRFENEQKNRDNWSYSINYQPFIGISVNTQWGVTATIRSTRSVTFDYRTAGAVNKREQSGLNISASYSVSKGFKLPIPFIETKRLNNEIQFQLAFDQTSSKNFSRNVTESKFQELDVNESWKLRPSISYRFSQKVNGTAFFEASSSTNKRTGTTTAKEFGINVNIAIR